jgi:hypothetical protein
MANIHFIIGYGKIIFIKLRMINGLDFVPIEDFGIKKIKKSAKVHSIFLKIAYRKSQKIGKIMKLY